MWFVLPYQCGDNSCWICIPNYRVYFSSTSSVTLTTSSPVMVVQFMKSQNGRNNPEQADPAMSIVPSNSNFITVATFITPIYSGGRTADEDYINYVTLVIENGQQGMCDGLFYFLLAIFIFTFIGTILESLWLYISVYFSSMFSLFCIICSKSRFVRHY